MEPLKKRFIFDPPNPFCPFHNKFAISFAYKGEKRKEVLYLNSPKLGNCERILLAPSGALIAIPNYQ